MQASRKLWAVGLSAALLGGCLVALAQSKMAGEEADAAHRLERMTKELNLTADQQEKLKPILDSQDQDWKAMHADASMTPAQKRAKAKEMHEKYGPQINAVLTPEQQTKWKQMKQEAWEKHKEGMKGGSMDKQQ